MIKLEIAHKWPWICSVCRNHNHVLFPFMSYHWGCNTRVTRQVPLLEQELLALLDHLSLPWDFNGRVAQWVRSLDLTAHTSLSPIRLWFAPSFVNYKKGALDSQLQVIKFTICLPMVGGFLRILRLLPPLKLVAMILMKVALSTKKSTQTNQCYRNNPFLNRS